MSTEPLSELSEHSDHVLKREFTLWSSFAFAFAFISPIVALYGIFALAVGAAGGTFWFGFFLVWGGQLLVALVFAHLVSRWPLEGSIYQWSRRLMGNGYGWFAGWAYMWTLVIAMSTVALGAAGFLANIVGVESPTPTQKAVIAFVILLAGTGLNLVGRQALKIFMTASIVAEVVGSLGLGTWLLLFHRHQPLSVLVEGTGSGLGGGYLSLGGPFLVAVAFIGWSFVGFESAGAIAEEVRDPRRNLPKAVIRSLCLIALVVAYSSLAIILAIPDMGRVTSALDDPDHVGDPVSYALTTAFGDGIARPVEVLFVIGFLASFLALQTSASRVIWAYARDEALPAHRALSRLSRGQRQPVVALLVTTVVGSVLFLLSNLSPNVYLLMVNFTTGGFFIAFLFPLVGALVSQLRGTWRPSTFSLGRATLPLSVAAVLWATFEFLNIAWPRHVNDARYLDWSVWIAIVVLGVVGLTIFAVVRRRMFPAEAGDDELDDDGHRVVAVGGRTPPGVPRAPASGTQRGVRGVVPPQDTDGDVR
ncbi:APC family permease [Microlunatus flavus]|uniref:Amino acid transporter n=1 Tax=Microlunatus flavus TaxID=1036181 RepID=A0A1H9NAQ8_9ACTN|nr:amino acid permease [Microlunatus flavus]SER33056.1 Amino acid transporter [Microlunatus flavus]